MKNPLEMYDSLGLIADLSKRELALLAKYQAAASIKGDDPLVEGEKAYHFFERLRFLSEQTIIQINGMLDGKIQSSL